MTFIQDQQVNVCYAYIIVSEVIDQYLSRQDYHVMSLDRILKPLRHMC